jgi:hypothetical protein
MPKVKLNELTDATVSHISLVDRGANREPFRIIKAEGEDKMLDFSNGFGGIFTRKSDARPPQIIAVAFAKNADPAFAASILKSAELEHGDAIASETALTFPIGDAKPEDMEQAVVFKINDDVAVAIRYDEPETVRKGFSGYDFESTDFGTVMATNKTPALIACAMSALQDTIYNCLSNADKVEVAKGDIEKALNDFSGVVLDVVGKVPETAFKLEAAVAKAGAVKKTEDTDQASDTANGGDGEGQKEPAPTGQGPDQTKELERRTSAEPTEQEKEGEKAAITVAGTQDDTDTSGENVKKGDGAGADDAGGDTGGAGDEQKPNEGVQPADLKKALGEVLGEALKPIQDTLTQVTGKVETLEKSAAQTAKTLKKVDDEFGLGTIGDDTGGEEVVTKGDNDDEDGGDFIVIDTAYNDPFSEDEKRSLPRA